MLLSGRSGRQGPATACTLRCSPALKHHFCALEVVFKMPLPAAVLRVLPEAVAIFVREAAGEVRIACFTNVHVCHNSLENDGWDLSFWKTCCSSLARAWLPCSHGIPQGATAPPLRSRARPRQRHLVKPLDEEHSSLTKGSHPGPQPYSRRSSYQCSRILS